LNAVILAHNYQVPEIQDVGIVGDSLGLSQQAAKTQRRDFFLRVHFMARRRNFEPEQIVVLPDKGRGLLAGESVRRKIGRVQKPIRFRAIAYINAARREALCDVICTSGTRRKLSAPRPRQGHLFVPDENLGQWSWSKRTSDDFVERKLLRTTSSFAATVC